MGALPATESLSMSGMPHEVLDNLIRDLAVNLFAQIDVNCSGSISTEEMRAAIEQRRREAETTLHELSLVKSAHGRINQFFEQVPGTKAHKEWLRRQDMRRVEEMRKYEKYLQVRDRRAGALDAQHDY